jgi:intracellular septation protein
MIKFITEYCPIICFFISYKLYGIFYATGLMMIVTIISLALSFYYEGKISKTTLISSGLLLFSSALTLLTGNSAFIKIKPTIVYSLFGIILYIGLFYNRIFLKSMLSNKIKLEDRDWIIFSKRFSIFFFFLAILNEIIWRNFSENFWVNYKLFGTPPMMIVFFASQIFFLYKNKE